MSVTGVEIGTMIPKQQRDQVISKTVIPDVKIGAVLTATTSQANVTNTKYGKSMNILRQVIGGELRRRRLEQSRTLREVSAAAQVSLGYLSEVERGQKEPSSELLNSICQALDTPLSQLLASVAMEIARNEVVSKPINTAGISQKSVTVAA